jgi:putative ABC transport system permease protein
VVVDLLHLERNLRRAPASALAAVLTLSLTLGIGGAIFAVVDAVVLTPLPFDDPAALVAVGETPLAEPNAAPRAVGYATFEAWRERSGSMAKIEATDATNLTLTELGPAERLNATNVTPGFLALLGVQPALGRTFVADDIGQPVAIVSSAFWREKLAADPNAIGRQIVLGGQRHTIVGVLPQSVSDTFGQNAVWRPFPGLGPGDRMFGVARLAANVSAGDLGAALGEISRDSAPPAYAVVQPWTTRLARDTSGMLAVLAGAAALALLIAFTNLAGLLTVRSIDRRRELAVRSALGAQRFEIAKQLLLEAGVLVALGVALGGLAAVWTTPLVARLVLEQVGPVARDVAVSWRVIAVVSIMALACAFLFAALPAFLAARRNSADALRLGSTAPPRERFLRRVFVTGEVALAFVLLVSMTLLGKSLLAVLRVDPGFDAERAMAMQVSLPAARYPGDVRVVSFYSALQSALEGRLGPRSVAIVDELPLTGDRGRELVGTEPASDEREAVVRSVTPGYFDVLGIPMVAGRSFDRSDDAAAPPRVLLSRSLAERLFASAQPIGRRVFIGRSAREAEIVGVVGDVKHRALDEPDLPTMYVSAWQVPSHSSILVARRTRPDADMMAAVRDEVARLDADLPVYGVRTMDDVLAASPGVPERRILTAAYTGFGLLAVVLGALGLFGVAAHDVASRRSELALRLALGADSARLLRATLGQSALLVAAGLTVGGLLSIWTSRALGSLVLATDGFDLWSVALPTAVLVAAGVGAVLPAARRAARTDPLIALRGE